jgi:hypothetical protein
MTVDLVATVVGVLVVVGLGFCVVGLFNQMVGCSREA